MLRITMSLQGENAARYFTEVLSTNDYYVKDQEGHWGGKGAEMLGLLGAVTREEFSAIAANRLPGKPGTKLTAQTKQHRRAGYDFCFSVPKSVSLYMALAGEDKVENMVLDAFRETMSDIESAFEVRVRKYNQDWNRVTGNMVYGWFVHRETRPVNGLSDPHFHIHAYVFNATFDQEENCWKAGQFGNLKSEAPFYEAAFNARLAEKLIKEGYGIRRTERSFELASVPRELIEKFSQRTIQIEKEFTRQYTVLSAKAKALALDKGMEFSDALALVKAELGKTTRESKPDIKLSLQEQRNIWHLHMTPQEVASLHAARGAKNQDLLEGVLGKSLTVNHLFERVSVARRLHAAAALLRMCVGKVSVEQAKNFALEDSRFLSAGPKLITTREVLREESDILSMVERGRNSCQPIGGRCENTALSEDQKMAIKDILESRDLINEIRGIAGSGKTTTLRGLVEAVKEVYFFAPSCSAVEVLKKEGFKHSDTVQSLMRNKIVQESVQGKTLIVDEAGFLSSKQLRWLMDFSIKKQSRLVLCGDSKQHHAVERGDALRVLESLGALRPAILTKIFRQKVALLREAIGELARGNTLKGFDKLEKHNAIVEIEDQGKRLEAICELYRQSKQSGKTSLIVAPDHAECRQISERLRGRDGYTFSRLANLNLTKAQQRDPLSYEPGTVIEFSRFSPGGFRNGEQWTVIYRRESDLILKRNGVERSFNLDNPERFSAFKVQPFSVAPGDQVRVTKNFKTGKTRLLNNSLYTVTSVCPLKVSLGEVELRADKALHLDQGFAVTSHAAQGKTVDEVIVSAPVDSFSQVNQAQFYVSMSRARESMHLFTDSKAALREAVSRPSERLSPIELLQNQARENLARTVRPEISRMATSGSTQPDHQILVR